MTDGTQRRTSVPWAPDNVSYTEDRVAYQREYYRRRKALDPQWADRRQEASEQYSRRRKAADEALQARRDNAKSTANGSPTTSSTESRFSLPRRPASGSAI